MSETNVAVAIMNQVPGADAAVRSESPLHHVDLVGISSHSDTDAGIVFSEVSLLGHLTLRCEPTSPLMAIAESILGVAIPLMPLTSVEHGDLVVRWIAPDEWLISLPNDRVFDLEKRFRAEMNGHHSLVNGSGGMTVYKLRGKHVIDMLKKSTPVDLHDSEFPVGKVVSTVFAKAGAVIRRTGASEFELVVRRSFADYIWLWIQDASQEYGLALGQ